MLNNLSSTKQHIDKASNSPLNITDHSLAKEPDITLRINNGRANADSSLYRWNSCKQNKQAANNCAANQNQTPSPEGEKLHSDSGISVDSQSLQEQQGQTQAQTGTT